MKKALLVAGAVLVAFFAFRACSSSPTEEARDTVEEFIEKIRDEDGKSAVKMLYPPYRDALAQELKLPLQLTEMKPSEVLACVLSSMGENVKKVKYLDAKTLDEKHAEVVIKVVDKQGVEKLFAFILIKDEKKWKIANISSLK